MCSFLLVVVNYLFFWKEPGLGGSKVRMECFQYYGWIPPPTDQSYLIDRVGVCENYLLSIDNGLLEVKISEYKHKTPHLGA